MRRVLPYLPFLAILTVPLLFYPSADSTWVSSSDVHAALEFAAALFAVTAGVKVLLHFLTTGRRSFLIISCGFVLIGAEEFVHGIFSFTRIWAAPPAAFNAAIPITWLSGHLVLAGAFLIAIFFREQETAPEKRASAAIFYNLVGLLAGIAVSAALFYAPFLPDIVRPGSPGKKIVDIFLGSLYFTVFVSYSQQYFKERPRSFILWSLSAFLVSRILVHIFTFGARSFYDAHWDLGHLTVVLSYLFPIFGIWGETLRLHRTARAQVIELEKAIGASKQAETELGKSESNLQDAKALLHSVIDNAPALIYTLNTEGRFISVNKTLCALLGRRAEELTGRKRSEIMPPEAAAQHEENDRTIIKSGAAQQFEENLDDGKDGASTYLTTKFPLRGSNGEIIGVGGVSTDITARKQAEAERQKFFLLAESSREFIGMCDLDMKPFYVNPAGRRMVGLPDMAAACRIKVQDYFFREDQRFIAEEFFPRVLRDGHGDVEIRLRNFRTDEPAWVFYSLFSLKDSDGKPVGWATVSHDITERRKAEAEIRELTRTLERRVSERTAQLEAANKELEAFSYSVSHDLRAPLRAVDGYAGILLEDHAPRLNDEGKRVCGVISESARDMGKLIDDLLAFSRVGRSEMKASAIDMQAMAKALYHEITDTAARKRIDFQLGPLPSAVADPALLRLVWINLLSNAVKFSSKKVKAGIKINSERNAGGTIYSVSDNGAGFDMRYAGKLFGVFQRLHSTKEFEGTGVGLAIVQRIILRHGGRVWAEGEPGKGATFHFTLGKET